jgi:hypothetical protein
MSKFWPCFGQESTSLNLNRAERSPYNEGRAIVSHLQLVDF